MASRRPTETLKGLVRARDLIHDCFDEPLSVSDLAEVAGMSRFHFLRSFTQVFGATPHAHLIEVRLEHARKALARGGSVTEACLDAGYDSLGSFSVLFKRRFGTAPLAWQRRTRTLIAVPGLWPALWVPGCFLLVYGGSNIGEEPPRSLVALRSEGDPKMIEKVSYTTVYALDQDSAKAFYTEKLGFEVRQDERMGDFRWLTVGPKTQPDVAIVLMPVAVGPTLDEEKAAMRTLVESGALGGGVLSTSDCRATYEELKAKGVAFSSEPKEMPYGIEALFRDDSGNFFSLTQRL